MAYLLDANVFITAKRLHYGFDFCPGFWDWLVMQHDQGRVFSVEQVGDELSALEDELSTWAAKLGTRFFLPTSPADVPSLAAVSGWATGQQYDPAAVSTFLQKADYYLVVQAHAHGHVVVTHEVPAASPRKIKIPDACIGVGVKYITTPTLLRRERARFVLEKSA
jgi:hypothetical protein